MARRPTGTRAGGPKKENTRLGYSCFEVQRNPKTVQPAESILHDYKNMVYASQSKCDGESDRPGGVKGLRGATPSTKSESRLEPNQWSAKACTTGPGAHRAGVMGGSHRGPNVVGLTGRTSFEQRLKPFRRSAQGRRDLTGCPPGAVDLLGLAGEAEGAEEAAEGRQEGHVPERKRRDEPSQRGQGGQTGRQKKIQERGQKNLSLS